MSTSKIGWLILAVCSVALDAAETRDRFGGWTGVQGARTGFFHAQQISNVWWLITPEGNAFYSKGVNNLNYAGDHSPALGYSPYGQRTKAKYGSPEKWAAAAAGRLRDWGFNTVGAWSTPVMRLQQIPYAPVLNLASSAGANWQSGEVADVFSPQFEARVRQQAARECAGRVTDPFLLGYFTDNELRWGPDWRSKKTLFEEFMALPSDRPGKQAILRLIRVRYSTPQKFGTAFGTKVGSWDAVAQLSSLALTNEPGKALQQAFLREYARAYFKTCRDAIRAVDPNHLIIGCRFAGYAPDPVIDAMGEFIDLVSFNHYGKTPPEDQLRVLYDRTHRPVALTEFSFKGQDSGLPNTRGAGTPVPTQQDRAQYFERYVTALARLPYTVGYHWFEYGDEPAQGRFDGENSNYGLVNIKDEPWQVLVEHMTRVNDTIERLHTEAK